MMSTQEVLTRAEVVKILQSLNEPLSKEASDALHEFFVQVTKDKPIEIVAIKKIASVEEPLKLEIELTNGSLNFQFHSHPYPVEIVDFSLKDLKPHMELEQIVVHTTRGDTYMPMHILTSNPLVHNFIDVRKIDVSTSNGNIMINIPEDNITNLICKWW